ncbi:hypothetical protein BH11VER1_BH11VER1_10030 [soil metagenome]
MRSAQRQRQASQKSRRGYGEGKAVVRICSNDWIPFGVSYRSLVPRGSECINLLTPTCPSSSYVAYGAYRLEWTFMAAAQATAQAAVMAVEDNVPVQQVDYARLRERLLKAGQVMEVNPSD